MLDNPTEGYGNCFPNAIVQQCRRPEIKSWLQKNRPWAIFNGQQLLRLKVTNFALKSRHATIADLKRTYEEEIQQVEGKSWTQYWNEMAQDGTWVDHIFVQVTAWYMELDILILTTSSLPEHPFISISGNNNNIPVPNGPPLLVGNYTNVHYQSLLPKNGTLKQEQEQAPRQIIPAQDNQKTDDFIYVQNGDQFTFKTLDNRNFQCPHCEKLFTRIVTHINNPNCEISRSNINSEYQH